MGHPEFPSDETLAAFIDGQADAETRKRVIEHMVGCNDCYATFEAATAMRQRSYERMERFPKQRRVAVIALLAAAVAAFVAFLAPMLRPRAASGLSKLAAAAPPERIIEGRLTAFPYRPLAPVTRGPGDSISAKNPDNWKLLSVAAQIQEVARKTQSVENLHALGASHLLLGNWDEAVTSLEEALRMETGQAPLAKALATSHDAQLLSDLSAAYYSRAKNLRQTRDYALATESAEDAWRIRKTPEIAWNRAIAIQALHGGQAERAAWTDYLALDATSSWASEAQQRAAKVSSPPNSDLWRLEQRRLMDAATSGDTQTIDRITDLFPTETSSFVQDNVIAVWLDSPPTDRGSRVAGALTREVAAIMNRDHHDSLLQKTVALVDATSDLALLKEAHITYRDARERYSMRDIDQAIVGFRKSRSLFVRAHSPFVALATLYEGSSLYYKNQYAESLKVLNEATSSSPTVAGMLAWARGLDEAELGHVYEALGFLQEALSQFTMAGEGQNAFAVHDLLAQIYYLKVGDDETAWFHRGRTVALLKTVTDPLRWSVWAESLTNTALDEGMPSVARIFADELVSRAQVNRTPDFMCNALVRRARAFANLGESKAAHNDILAAKQLSEKIRASEMRDKVRLFIADGEADIDRSVPTSNLDAAIAFADRVGDHYMAATLRAKRGRIRSRERNLAGAEEDFLRSIVDIEKAARTADAMQRQYSFLVARDYFDEAVDVLLRDNKVEEARTIAARFQRLVLGQPVRERSDDQFSTVSTPHAPPGAAMVAYYVLPNRVSCWVTTTGVSAHVEVLVDREKLKSLVDSLRQAILAVPTESDTRTPQLELTRILIEPIRGYLRDARVLYISPDADLWNVPFAILTGQHGFLIEDFEIQKVASAVNGALRGSSVKSDSPSVFVGFGNPKPNRFSPGAPELSGAEREVSGAARQFSVARVFIGENASKGNFISAAPGSNYLHVAAHATPGTRPDTAAVIMAGGNGTAEFLYAADITKLYLKHCRCVVLSGCKTAPASPSGGVIVLANAFLAAGAHSVIGTLWDIDDTRTPYFFRRFYAELKEGMSAGSALRRAQISAAHDRTSRLRDWAGFQTITTSINGGVDSRTRN